VPPQPQPANLTIKQMKVGITRLNRRIADLEAFDSNSVQQRWAPEVKALQTSIKESLSAVLGHDTVEYNRYRRAAIFYWGPVDAAPQSPRPNRCALQRYRHGAFVQPTLR
jgi:hypothetical protein